MDQKKYKIWLNRNIKFKENRIEWRSKGVLAGDLIKKLKSIKKRLKWWNLKIIRGLPHLTTLTPTLTSDPTKSW